MYRLLMRSRWEMKGLGGKTRRDRMPLGLMNWPLLPTRRLRDGKAVACQQLVRKIDHCQTDSSTNRYWGRKVFIRHGLQKNDMRAPLEMIADPSREPVRKGAVRQQKDEGDDGSITQRLRGVQCPSQKTPWRGGGCRLFKEGGGRREEGARRQLLHCPAWRAGVIPSDK